jgi:Domain of unknown function (DUF5916)
VVIAAVLAAAAVQVVPTRVTDGPRLDGRLDDPAWLAAVPFTGFEPTTARFLYTDDALWIGIDCVQQRSRLVRRLTRRDREVDADRVEVDLDTRGSGRSAYMFAVNATGVLVDGLRYDDTEVETDWDDNWEALVARTPRGWSAEIRIPLRILRYADRGRQSWGIQVRRFVSARQETDELAPIPRGEAGEVSRYGALGPFDALPAEPSLALRPFALSSLERGADGAYTPRASAGGDLQWRPSPSFTIDATMNPDFAQVEADQQVLDLTTYETFFPEKRPFFLDGADLFATPIMALYTRRIGRAPDPPALPGGETAAAAPAPARIWGAAKLTGTAGDTSIGALAAVTGADLVATRDPAGAHERLADPWTVYGVARVRRGLGERGYVGGFATAVGRIDGGVDHPRVAGGALCPDGAVVADGARCTHDALVVGLDGRWRSSSDAYLVQADVAASGVRGGPPRLQRDGIAIASGDVSPQGRVLVAKESDGVVFDAELEAYGRRFDMNDAGYLQRADLVHAYGDLGWKDSDAGRLIRTSRTQIEVFGSENWRGERLSGGYQINASLTFANYWSTFTELHWRPWHFDDREIGDGTALERAGHLGWEQAVSTDPRRTVVVTASQSLYLLRDALEYGLDGDVTIHALPRLDLELLPSLELARGEPRYVETLADGIRSFGRQDATGAGLSVRATYTFTPRATVQLYGQLFGQRVAYRDVTTAAADLREVRLADLVPATSSPPPAGCAGVVANGGVVLRWEWRLGSLLYVVYSRAQGVDRVRGPTGADPTIPWRGGLGAAAAQVVLVKASYWWG